MSHDSGNFSSLKAAATRPESYMLIAARTLECCFSETFARPALLGEAGFVMM